MDNTKSGLMNIKSLGCFEKNKRRTIDAVQLDGPKKGFIKPIEKKDTLIYTVNRLADSVLIRK